MPCRSDPTGAINSRRSMPETLDTSNASTAQALSLPPGEDFFVPFPLSQAPRRFPLTAR
jgi:hypothetical protein